MPAPSDPRELLLLVARRLGEVQDQFVFLGGAAAALYITDPAGVTPRATKDVDALIECKTYSEYVRKGESLLGPRGFVQDTSPRAPMCRWRIKPEDVLVDVIPTAPEALGLRGRWFQDAFANALPIELGTGEEVRVISAPHFVATKLEAFRDRGGGDYYGSHDLEDLISVVDGREELSDEVARLIGPVRDYLRAELGKLLNEPGFRNALPGHLAGDEASQMRLGVVRDRLERIASP